ncbi:MAG: calcium/proton exchanger [Candidatus Aquicultorales bacterium]
MKASTVIANKKQKKESPPKANGGIVDLVFLVLLTLVPIAIVLEVFHAPSIVVFIASAAAVIPLARWLGQATEHLSAKAGAGLGAFLNASFGNAAELIISFFALRAGLQEVVKASLTGAIIGNILLVMGLAFLFGGLKYEKQAFNRTAAGMSSTLLVLSAIGLLVPALFHFVTRGTAVRPEASLSLEISIVLIATYFLSLIFSFKTHKHLYRGEASHEHKESHGGWSVAKSLGVLVVAGVFVALMSEFLVGSVEEAAEMLGMSEIFVGVIFVAIIGNAAEHSSAITIAVKDKMDVSLGIALGSSQQVALFVAPLLVFVGRAIGQPMDLVFTPFEVAAVGISVLVTGFVAMDGESNWMEGVLLVAVYIILGMAFYFLPA